MGMRIFHPELLSGGNRACPSPSMMIFSARAASVFAIVVGLGGISPRHVISDGLVSWNFSLHRPRCCWPAFISRSSCSTIGYWIGLDLTDPEHSVSEPPGDPRPVGEPIVLAAEVPSGSVLRVQQSAVRCAPCRIVHRRRRHTRRSSPQIALPAKQADVATRTCRMKRGERGADLTRAVG